MRQSGKSERMPGRSGINFAAVRNGVEKMCGDGKESFQTPCPAPRLAAELYTAAKDLRDLKNKREEDNCR
jgi:hypothetical protein